MNNEQSPATVALRRRGLEVKPSRQPRQHVPCGGMSAPHDPSPILQTAFSFWNSKVLLTAVEMGLFTRLGNRSLTGAQLGSDLGLHPRGIKDFFDALVAMGFLGKSGHGPGALYSNTPEGTMYLDEKSPRYIGGILKMLNVRLFKYWHDLPEALRTGQPQNEVKQGEKGIFEALYKDPEDAFFAVFDFVLRLAGA